MSQLKESFRTGLEVGFAGGDLPERLRGFRARDFRSIAPTAEFPYEDEQFQVVVLAEGAVGAEAVRETHRVLKKGGLLVFAVPAQSRLHPEGYTLPKVYSLLRNGFDIVRVEEPRWWKFWQVRSEIVIEAHKKNWKTIGNSYRPYVVK